MALPIEATRHDIYDFISPHHGTKDAAKGKSVLITGAGTGIGKAIVKQFALAGATRLILTGRRPGPLEETKAKIEAEHPNCQVLYVPTDVSNPAAVANLFAETGKVDILVNNAGSIGVAGTPIADSDFEGWWQAYEVNVKGNYLMTRGYLRALAGRPGVVINMSSMGSVVAVGGYGSYQTSKSALNRLTEFVDKEYSPQGVVAIAFHPGGIAGTDLTKLVPEWLSKTFQDTPDLGGATAVYLSTPRAAFLSGRFVSAQWDMEELEKLKDKILERNDMLKTRVVGMNFQLGP